MFISSYFNTPIQLEIVGLCLAGMLGLIFDSSFISFNNNMEKIWDIALDPYKFPPMTQLYLKYFISVLVLIKTFTLHAALAMYVVMLWPAVFAERPYLMLPWLIVGSLRLLVNVLSLVAGLYVSSAYGLMNSLWLEFILMEIVEHGPFLYIWLSMLRYFAYLQEEEDFNNNLMQKEQYKIKNKRKSRQQLMWQARYFKDVVDDGRNLISQSTIESIIHYMDNHRVHRRSRSLDSLMAIMAKEKENEAILNVQNGDDDENVSMRFIRTLKITDKDIEEAKRVKLNVTFSEANVQSDIIDEKPHLSQAASANCLFMSNKVLQTKLLAPPRYFDQFSAEIELRNINLTDDSLDIARTESTASNKLMNKEFPETTPSKLSNTLDAIPDTERVHNSTLCTALLPYYNRIFDKNNEK